MSSRADTFKKTQETTNFFKERFLKNIGTRQSDMWATIFKVIKNLDTDPSGNILSNSKNLRTLRELRGNLKSTIVTTQYKKDVEKFLGGFNELKGINDTYYQAIAASKLNANKQLFIEITNSSISATKASLLDSGVTEAIIKPVEALLNQNVTTGGSFTDLTEVLRKEILGDEKTLGKLERYTSQITTDSLNQFNANYNQSVAQNLDLEFYYYNGGIKTTTREYCKDNINGGRYFHKKEIEKSANRQWAGKIPSTNSSNILIYRGGFNCGHQWLAVDSLAVPKTARDRAEAKGYYKPTQ